MTVSTDSKPSAAIKVSGENANLLINRPPSTYPAFWHLEAVGVTDGSRGAVWPDVFSSTARQARVAMIDNGVDVRHPYISPRITEALDLTGLPVRPVPVDRPNRNPSVFKGLVEQAGLLAENWAKDETALLLDLASETEGKAPFDTRAPDTSNRTFAMHGTSAAGLIMARTPIRKTEAGLPAPVPYFGVDPDAQLIPITTSFGDSPRKLIIAVLYALKSKADVIFIPRGFSSSVMDAALAVSEAPGNATGDAEYWKLLQKTLISASHAVPIVCAAGNDGQSQLVAPAALAAWDAGRNGIIAVGAMNFNGMRSSYSNYGPGLTVVAPSDDGEVFTEDQIRLDATDRAIAEFPYMQMVTVADLGNRIVPFADQEILAIDIGGEGGAATGNDETDAYTQQSGYFTGFGGTSAASAIVAGVCALAQRMATAKHGKPLTGPEMKDLLARSASKSTLHNGGTGALKPDHFNRADLSFEEAFGAGLVDARALLKLI